MAIQQLRRETQQLPVFWLLSLWLIKTRLKREKYVLLVQKSGLATENDRKETGRANGPRRYSCNLQAGTPCQIRWIFIIAQVSRVVPAACDAYDLVAPFRRDVERNMRLGLDANHINGNIAPKFSIAIGAGKSASPDRKHRIVSPNWSFS